MVIALDATPLTLTSGGLRRYTEELTRALAETEPLDTLHLISDTPGRDSRAICKYAQIKCQVPGNLFTRRWWLIGLPLELKKICADVFHGTNFEVPYVPVRPTVVTIHDLSPWKTAGWHGDAGRVRRRMPLLLRLGLATMVITPTEAVRRELLSRFSLDNGRVAAVPEAPANWLAPVVPRPAADPYFVYVGTIEPRKNLQTIIEAWREVRRRFDVDLVLAGRTRQDSAGIRQEPGLRLLGEVPDSDLSGLYSAAVAALYPSFYEGFGLPVLEAMRCGAAVIASRDPALMEVSGGAALHVDALDVRGWATAMEGVLANSEERASRRERSLQRAGQFSWTETARKTREVYVEAIHRFSA